MLSSLRNAVDLGGGGGGGGSGGGKRSGAEGWSNGHVARFLGDMRAAGVTPSVETYQCAIRCATDAAILDAAEAAEAVAGSEGEGAAPAIGSGIGGDGAKKMKPVGVEGGGGGGGGGAALEQIG